MEMFNLMNALAKVNCTEDSIHRIYHGGDHVCRCGCAGKYFERGSKGFTRALNALRKGFMTESNGEVVYVYGYGHNEEQISKGIDITKEYINVPIYDDANHNKCYCLYFN